MRWVTKDHTYEADWETVTSAFWVKYPNDKQKHVKSVDTLYRELDTENAILRIRRLVNLNYDIPEWCYKIGLPKLRGRAIEDATVSLHDKTLFVQAQNISLSNYISVGEEYHYRVHPENPQWTKYSITHNVTFHGFPFIASKLENSFIDKVKDKFRDGLEVMQQRITSLQNEDWKRRTSGWQEEVARMTAPRINIDMADPCF